PRMRIGLPGVLVAVLIGVTVPTCSPMRSPLATYTVLPSGVTATSPMLPLMGIGFPARSVAVLIGTIAAVIDCDAGRSGTDPNRAADLAGGGLCGAASPNV